MLDLSPLVENPPVTTSVEDVSSPSPVRMQRARAARGFRTFQTARATLAGIELVHMIRKGQVQPIADGTDAGQFYALAA